MSFLVALLAVQAAGAVPERSPELDAANDCLVENTHQWLADRTITPEAEERWRWAGVVVARCEKELAASVPSKSSQDDVLSNLRREGAPISFSRQDLIRAEALYYVDGMIRAHFENLAK